MRRLLLLIGIALALLLPLSASVADARPATRSSGLSAVHRHCPSRKQLYEGLSRKEKRHVVHLRHNRYGISGIRCAKRWAAAGIDLNFGGVDNAYPLLEHRRGRRWHSLDRNRPCRRHLVPPKIYAYACDAS